MIVYSSCSRKKSTMISRAYHNTTARYNGYFNAKEIIKENEQKLKDAYVYDYSQVLPIFIYPDEQKSQQMYPEMDRVIDKCSEVIERHSMYLRKEEHVKWINDSYFLIGKARFYKMQHELGEETFLYTYQAYKRDPERYQGLNWLIKTYIEMREWDKAEEFLDIAEDEQNKIPKPTWGEINATAAELFLQKDKDLDKVIERLETAIRFVEDKDDKRRYTFILAQIYQDRREYSSATQYYTSVLKLKPDYTMRFNAKIRRAISLDITASNADDIKKEMKKMLRDKKNEEFRDQIYYALAEISLKEDNEPQAIDYLKKSVKFSVSNQKQKALSYLKLADIHFEQPDYLKAQLFYDSTLQYLPEDHPEYYDADEKNESLQDLVKNLKIIKRQDSLLALGGLSEKEREKKVKELIKELKAEEERKRQQELRALELAQAEREQSAIVQNNNSGRKGEWYFYNQTTLALGRTDFKRIWGERQLADDWRRASKNIAPTEIDQQAGTNAGGSVATNEEDNEIYDPEFYMKDIPVDLRDRLQANGKVIEALFNVGTIFKESFEDYKNAEQAFKRITVEYDTSRYNLPAHYQLYRIYLLVDDQEKANVEKEWVLNNHPFSEYAYLIKNPDYNKESKESKEKVEDFYESTYRLYKYELYADVIESCNKAESVFKINHLEPQFDFLKAKAIGYTSSKEEFRDALEAVVADHPNTEVKKQAEEILRLLNQSGTVQPKSEKPQFDYNPMDKHMYVLSLPINSAKANDLKIKISNFNKEFFREGNLEFTTTTITGKKLFLIRTFSDEKQAMRYLRAIRNQLEISLPAKQEGGKDYLISNENFKILFKTKKEDDYLEFFSDKYPT
ncbi:MAG: hypothetical protein CMP59_03650 [Flavobacteriales bacterium]|nr:hypothetical protein [Flavobacteriales bacterium]